MVRADDYELRGHHWGQHHWGQVRLLSTTGVRLDFWTFCQN